LATIPDESADTSLDKAVTEVAEPMEALSGTRASDASDAVAPLDVTRIGQQAVDVASLGKDSGRSSQDGAGGGTGRCCGLSR
jgi:hypothetical protein